MRRQKRTPRPVAITNGWKLVCNPSERFSIVRVSNVDAAGTYFASTPTDQRAPMRKAFILVSLLVSFAVRASTSPAQPGPYSVQTLEVTWRDDVRHRTIAAKIYAPVWRGVSSPQPSPVIVFSHGLGNSKEGYSYLGEHWASHGYISIHPDHPGADAEVTKHGLWHLYRAGFDRGFWTTVPEDDRFVIDQVVKGNLPEALRGRVDTTRIGIAGHSIGAYAALAIGGMKVVFPGGPTESFRDERVRAAIPM